MTLDIGVSKGFSRQLLAFYGLCLMAYASVSLSIHPFLSSATCDAFNEEDLRAPMILLFSWLQNSASIMLLTLQACEGLRSHD